MWRAEYLSRRCDNEVDPSKDFATHTAAANYIFDQMCALCKSNKEKGRSYYCHEEWEIFNKD